jgi:hypothetical protein
LLWLAKRTRQLPELTMGGSLLLSGGFGGTLSMLAQAGSAQGTAGFAAASTFLMAVGSALLTLFTWRVFRRSERWAKALFAVTLSMLVVGQIGRSLIAGADFRNPGFFDWLGLVARLVAYAWASGEALHEYLAARRRCAIGLTDPLVANRLLLWGVGLGAVLLIWINTAVAMAQGTMHDPRWLLIATLGFICAGSLWLAFFPPAPYRRRFVGWPRHRRSSTSAMGSRDARRSIGSSVGERSASRSRMRVSIPRASSRAR